MFEVRTILEGESVRNNFFNSAKSALAHVYDHCNRTSLSISRTDGNIIEEPDATMYFETSGSISFLIIPC